MPKISPRPAAQFAAVAKPGGKLRWFSLFGKKFNFGHTCQPLADFSLVNGRPSNSSNFKAF